MARPRKRDCSSAADKLIDALWTCLESNRLSGITVSTVTKCAGLNRGTFYYHFRDMDDLTAHAIEREFNANALLPSIFDLITGVPSTTPAAQLVADRMRNLSLLVDGGGMDVLSTQVKQLVRQMWTAILCNDGESLKPETTLIIEYTTNGILGILANETMRATVQQSPDAFDDFIKHNSTFLLSQIGRAQDVPLNIIVERIQATRRVSRL